MFYNRKLLLAIGATITLSTISPIASAKPQRYNYAVVTDSDKLIGESQKQLTKIRVCLTSIAPIIKKNGKLSSETQEKAVAYFTSVDKALENYEKRKFTDTDTQAIATQLIILNKDVIDHLSEALRTNFKDIDSYDIEAIIIKSMTTRSASLEPKDIAQQFINNNKKLEQLEKRAQGLRWYNHLFRAVDNHIVTPCQKHSIVQRTLLAAGAVFLANYMWWHLDHNSFRKQWEPIVGEPLYNTVWGSHMIPPDASQYMPSNPPRQRRMKRSGRTSFLKRSSLPHSTKLPLTKDGKPAGYISKADHFGTTWLRNLSPIGPALTTYVLAHLYNERDLFYPKIKKQMTILKNKLKGGVYHKEAERAAEKAEQVRFSDIFGQHDIKRYLQHLVDYLKDPESADRLGLTPPRGILLIGDTRTGKTFCVNALLGEINDMLESTGQSGKYKMYHLDALMIQTKGIEYWLGLVKQSAPCIVFIDEIDLLYLQRTGANKTLSEFLTAMGDAVSSKDSKKQVIVIAATNRPETLDVALRQPGRFGKELRFEYPNYEDRLIFIKTKLTELSLSADGLDVAKLAKYTESKSYEALNMLIKNAIIKARLRGVVLSQAILDEALDEDIYHIIPNYTKNIPQHELDILTAHFAGQALALHLMDNSVQLAKVTIKQVMTELKEEFMGTHLMNNPDKEEQQRFEYGKVFTCHAHDSISMNSQATKRKLCKMYLAGFIAEELLLGSCSYSCHAEADRHNALTLAKSIAFEGYDVKTMPKHIQIEKYNQALALIEQCKQEVKELLAKNKDSLKRLSDALLEHKTLDRDQVAEVLK
ncbi:AAA family ATPase [Candidatus Dependentiae bacterium]|nr:MAG: AAA family ATPase [Candidatus Dependentiae bacterium]